MEVTGKNQDLLMETLEKIDSCTSFDTILKPDHKVTITGRRKNGKFSDWKLRIGTEEYKDSKPSRQGKTYDTLMDAIQSLDKEVVYGTDCDILCYCQTRESRDWNGKIISKWLRINPYCPYTVVDGQPKFETITFELDESDYKSLMATQLAFYVEETDTIYPIRPEAFSSIGKLLDCASAFKHLDEHMLGSALLIAEKMSYMGEIRCLYRDRSAKVKPILSIMGDRYTHYPQATFFRAVFNEVSKRGLFEIEHWSVSDEITRVVIRLIGPKPYQTGLIVQTGDCMGTSLSVTSFADMSDSPGGKMYLQTNSAYHTAKFGEEGGVKKLFHGIWKSIDLFYEQAERMEISTFRWANSNLLNKVSVAIGKKRMKQTQELPPGKYNSMTLFKNIMESTREAGKNLPEKQYNDLRRAYYDLFQQIDRVGFRA